MSSNQQEYATTLIKMQLVRGTSDRLAIFKMKGPSKEAVLVINKHLENESHKSEDLADILETIAINNP